MKGHKLKCCYDNKLVGGCKRGSPAEKKCNDMCMDSCGWKGGRCKVYANRWEYCHCMC